MVKIRNALLVSYVLLLLLTLFSCQTVEINFAPTKNTTPDTNIRYASVALGIKEWSKPEEKLCENKEPKKIVIRRTGLDAFLHALIGGVYTWRRIEVYCQ